VNELLDNLLFFLIPDQSFSMGSFKNWKEGVFVKIFKLQTWLPKDIFSGLPGTLFVGIAFPLDEIFKTF
jgi:hypothetical protein